MKKTKCSPIKVIPAICPLLDTDRDGAPDCKDCKPFDRRYQHKTKWKKDMIKRERFKRAYADDIIWNMQRGWSEEQAVARVLSDTKGKRSVNLEKIMKRHDKAVSVPGSIGFAADDIRRTKDVEEYIKKHRLKDLGSSIKL